MERELMHCHLRFTTTQAYDPALRDAGIVWVERSAEEFSLDEPTAGLNAGLHGERAVAGALTDVARAEYSSDEVDNRFGNPLREEPHPVTVALVRHFGVVGLVACALGACVYRGFAAVLGTSGKK
jgi:hypothetical protein